MKGLIVFDDPRSHLWTRGAALIASFYLVWAGNKYDDMWLKAIGFATMFWDAVTLKMTIDQL